MSIHYLFLLIYIIPFYLIFYLKILYSISISPPTMYFQQNSSLLLYRAVEDKRYNIIRILAAMDISVNNTPIEIKVNKKIVKYRTEVLGLVIKFNAEFPLKYVNFVIDMMLVDNISVNNIVIPYEPVSQIKYIYNYTVCITSLKNNFKAKNMLDQTLKIYQKEGVSHGIVYYGDISDDVYLTLLKYVRTGFLEIYYWPKLEILSFIRNHGQIIKMNDCLYRSYYNSKYIINSDIDEIIIPKELYYIDNLIENYKNEYNGCEMFRFYSKTFPSKNYIDNLSKYGRNSYNNLPIIDDFNIFEKNLSCKETKIRTKYIISTKVVEAVRFHDAITTDKSCWIRKTDGYCRHTRVIPKNNMHLCRNLTVDNTILKYS